ncbi:MAG: DUF4915 domain-containing protein [Pseudomonadota bacterium]
MPHSLRWHSDRAQVLNFGCGELGYVEFDDGKTTKGQFTRVLFCRVFPRGLSSTETPPWIGPLRLAPV